MATAIRFENAPERHYKYNPGLKEREAVFVASCIECAADYLGVPPEEIYLRMHRVGLIEDYIIPCYDVLHTESRQNVTEDIVRTLDIWEKDVK